MTTVAKKFQLGTAAFTVAAVLITPSVAFADTDESDSSSDSVGTSAGKTPKREGRGAKKPATTASESSSTDSAAPAVTPDAPDAVSDALPEIPSVGADATADATGPLDNPLFQNPLIWVGTPNPAPPTPIVEFETLPLEDVSEPIRGAFGWMQDFEFEACVLGLSSVTRGQTVAGPYGTATSSISGSGCA